TPNAVGLAGLGAGVDFVLSAGLESIQAHERGLTKLLIEGLSGVPGAVVYGPRDAEKQCAVVSFNLEDWNPSDLSFRLDEEFGILTRVGLHCAPSAHKTIGTFPGGTVRVSMGYLNTENEIAKALEVIETLARERR
ncbi:MAG TPA: aminotransferase class V-fold PLP-dependent enzyme, partial [Thermodesulfobacteriota bacterium]|nr:aminotransferase class V-fold PLP-dependent enzyme [Thermodesulfobacteriota bacterium]